MKQRSSINLNITGNLIIGFIFIILFILPVLFTRVNGVISWLNVFKIWKDQVLLIPISAINHWILAPRLMLKGKYSRYLISILFVIASGTISYYYYEKVNIEKAGGATDRIIYADRQPRDPNREPPDPDRRSPDENSKPRNERRDNKATRPTPIPPYAHLLMYSLLIVGVDSGLLFSKKWQENEEKKHTLEQKNTEMQLDILKNQISPHFFMNTLNNIYSLIDNNSPQAKEAVMKLSKLMRYMLYENGSGKVKLSREFEFIQSYIDLMKLRFAEEMTIHLIIPVGYADREIPPMLFISHIENAFKYGSSYQHESFINIVFEVIDNKLLFTCINTKHSELIKNQGGGLGLINSENRLKLLFGTGYSLAINSTEKLFNVSLEIPLS
jgi:hypothetical protein